MKREIYNELVRYWLMKSEPDTFSIQDLKTRQISGWDGVRNYQARNHLRSMRIGDQAFFYHSRIAAPAIVGLMEVVKEAYPDPSQFDSKSQYFDVKSEISDPRWQQVDVRFVKAYARPVSIEDIRREASLKSMVLLQNSRLSVQPVSEVEAEILLRKLS